MKNGLTELVFIMDRSGSMGGLETDTIGGFNSVLEKQKKVEGEANVTTVLFDDRYEILHDRIPIQQVNPMTEKEYYVRGSTALLDAIGRTIVRIEESQKHSAEESRAEKVLFIISTDGLENASQEYTASHVKLMIEHQKEKCGWEFLFLGANIDAVDTAQQIGIGANRAANYHPDTRGTKCHYASVDKAINQMRTSRSIHDDWKGEVDDDFQKRPKS
jgi:uncharacterized protein YegL